MERHETLAQADTSDDAPAHEAAFWSREREEELRRLIASPERLSYAQIGNRLGCTRSMARSKAGRLGIAALRPVALPKTRKAVPLTTVWPDDIAPAHGPDIETSGDARVRLADLEPHHCRWPVGDPVHDKDFGFCGRQKTAGQSYCEFHARRAQPVGGTPKFKLGSVPEKSGPVKSASEPAEPDLVVLFERQ